MLSMRLNNLQQGLVSTVQQVEFIGNNDLVAQRLCDLGFTTGTSIKVIARTPFKQGPLVIKLKTTQFAMRYAEAARIIIAIPTKNI